jgi:hypothetical protein
MAGIERQPQLVSVLTPPPGWQAVEFDGLCRCTKDDSIEQPALVVMVPGFPDELWSACVRYDANERRRGDPRYTATMPYWHPLVLVEQNETTAVGAAVVS